MPPVSEISSTDVALQSYSGEDASLISTFDVEFLLNSNSYIEFFIFDLNLNPLSSNLNYQEYSVLDTGPTQDGEIKKLIINPEKDAISQGIPPGSCIANYNFLDKQIGDPFSLLYISEISSDRTEVKLESTSLSALDIIEQSNKFIQFREEQNYFVDFYLNFGENNLIISNNIKLEDKDPLNPSILIKLYEPLPLQFNIKSKLWVVTTFEESKSYRITIPFEENKVLDYTQLPGPNFSIDLKNQVNNSSQNLSKSDILSTAITSSYNQLQSLLFTTGISINVDYNDFNDFINFSSAQTRVENFFYKVSLIETYTSESNSLSGVSYSTSSKLLIDNKISNLIKNFDEFEYFMYYSSGSVHSYPKTNSEPPYELYSTGSSEVLNWLGNPDTISPYYGGVLLTASIFDNQNNNQLLKSIPEYLTDDSSNQPYELFVDMVAQYYDNVWLYTKDITEKYNADNRLDFGISKDLVADAIRDFGVKLYQNNFSNKELYTAFLGLTPNGSLFPFPEITGSLPAPTGFEFVDTLISASNDVISMDDTNKSLYKRIYHNIPYLLKSKGTLTGLRALITSYGIPDTILKISEFGGKDKVNANDYDLYFNNFNYALGVGPDPINGNFLSSSFDFNNDFGATNDRPKTIEFRFKAEEITSAISPFGLTNLSQSLFTLEYPAGGQFLDIVLEYSGSGLDSGSLVNDSGSYNGAIKDPNYQYGSLKLIPSTGTPSNSASIYLPFFNGDWWSVKLDHDLGFDFVMSAGNSIYNGLDGTSIGYFDSVTKTASHAGYGNNTIMYLATSSLYPGFSGSIQELRCYKNVISESVFKDYIMNPLSFEGNEVNSAPDQLMFRAALGSELDITSQSSIHPKVTGSWATTSSFNSNSDFYLYSTSSYHRNTETFFLDQPAVGIKNRITDKIRSESDTLPSGDVLSPISKLSQTTEASASYTDNINYLEVAFSPQNQINDDIIGQLGHFNIGDYIGDPTQRFTGNNYPDLNNLSEEYFKKYIKQYDLVDFIRLIKFFDNSLFKMIKDFIPARTSLASGLVIKQHLLERNKYPQPQVSYDNNLQLSGSIDMYHISGGAGGMLNKFNSLDYAPGGSNPFSITQSWDESTPSLIGEVTSLHDSQDEFYNGEFSGSIILATNGELSDGCKQFSKPHYFTTGIFGYRIYNEPEYQEGKFLDLNNLPTKGFISIMNVPKAVSSFTPPPLPPGPTGSGPNTPTTVLLIESSSATAYTSNISVLSSPTTPPWTLNESDGIGDAISFSSAVTTNGYHMIFKNQLGEIIQGLTLDSFSLIAGVAGPSPTDVSAKFAASIEATGVPSAANALKLKTNDLFVFMGEQFDETLEYTINISSSNTAGTSTATTDGATFTFTPSAAWNNQAPVEYSLGNTGPDSLVNSSIVVDNTLRNNLGLNYNDEVLIFPTGPNFGTINAAAQNADVFLQVYNGNNFLKNGSYYSGTITSTNEVGLQLVTPQGPGLYGDKFIYHYDAVSGTYNDITQQVIYATTGLEARDYFQFNLSLGSGTQQVEIGFLHMGAVTGPPCPENAAWSTVSPGLHYILFTVEDANGAGITSTTSTGGTRYWCVTLNIT